MRLTSRDTWPKPRNPLQRSNSGLMPENLDRLRDRNLGRKRSLALREYALGLESVARLVEGEPL